MSNYDYEMNQRVSDALMNGIKKEASTIELYRRLAESTTNSEDQKHIINALQAKEEYFNQFIDIYCKLNNRQPDYQFDSITFTSYREGLMKAHEAGIEGYKEYSRGSYLTQDPIIQKIFLQASSGEIANATRFASMNDKITDMGKKPYVVNIEEVTEQNNNYRTALWTGKYLQVTLMSIDVGSDIGLEVHPTTDQFIRIEEGQGIVQMGSSKEKLDFVEKVEDGYAIMVPAGTWHNVTNTGDEPMKVYVIYAPPQHPFGTVHKTKKDAMAEERVYAL